MNRLPILSLALLFSAVGPLSMAAESLPGPNWNRAAALQAIGDDSARETLAMLYQLAREGRSEDLLLEVMAIAGGEDRPAPERDRVLRTLALALGEFDSSLVGPEVLEFLSNTRSRVRVPHDEHPELGVPLYNIRAAAAGSLAERARRERVEKSEAVGLLDTDFNAFIASVSDGSTAGITDRIRAARHFYGPAELEALVLAAPRMDNPGTASIVLAELAPDLLGRPAVDDLLFDLLKHSELGATAALTLARSGDDTVLERLAELAAGNEGLESRRASLAIDLFLASEHQE